MFLKVLRLLTCLRNGGGKRAARSDQAASKPLKIQSLMRMGETLRCFEVRNLSTSRSTEVGSGEQTRTEETSSGKKAAVGTLGKETVVAEAEGVQCGWGHVAHMK